MSTRPHLLLFFAPGHHLAWFDETLFPEVMYATDRGISLRNATGGEPRPIGSERLLNTIGYVVARYSALSPADLRTLVHASAPWQLAMRSASGPRIERAWLRDWFRRPAETDDPDDERPSRAEVAETEAFLASRGRH